MASISGQAPIRPRWPALRIAMTAKPPLCARVGGDLHRLLADDLAIAEAAIDKRRNAAVDDDLDVAVGQHHAGAGPIDIFLDADDAVEVVPDEVGLDQMVGDDRSLVRIGAGGAKNVLGECGEPVRRKARRRAADSAFSATG